MCDFFYWMCCHECWGGCGGSHSAPTCGGSGGTGGGGGTSGGGGGTPIG